MCCAGWNQEAQSPIWDRACAFVAEDGSPLPWLQPIHSIAVNGRHAILLAESMVRIEMLRSERTWELAITLHTISRAADRERPQIVSKPLFRGRDGVLSVDLWKEENRGLRGKLAPVFYSRAGEVLPLPPPFEEAIRKTTAAVCCLGCKHTHVGVPPAVVVVNQVTEKEQPALSTAGCIRSQYTLPNIQSLRGKYKRHPWRQLVNDSQRAQPKNDNRPTMP